MASKASSTTFLFIVKPNQVKQSVDYKRDRIDMSNQTFIYRVLNLVILTLQ